MNIPVLLITAIGLSIDSLAVSVVYGTHSCEKKINLALKFSLIFGMFHILMPLTGYLAGSSIKVYIEAVDHWIAFFILLFVGIKMIIDGRKEDSEDENKTYKTTLKVLIYLALATSIDALAVGISFSLVEIPVFQTVSIIGLSAFLFTFSGVWFGQIISKFIKFNIQFLGGILLIGIGTKILIEHLHLHYFC